MTLSQANKKQIGQELITIIIVIVFLIIGLLMFSSVISIQELINELPYPSIGILIFILIQNSLLLIPIYFLGIRKRNLKLSDFGFKKTNIPKAFLYIIGTFILFFASMIALEGIQTLFNIDIPGLGEQTNRLDLFGTGKLNQIIAAFSIIVIAPIVEEVIFRGYFYQTFKEIFSPKVAILFGGLIFGTIHMEFNVIIPLSILGFLICYLFEKTKSIWPGIIFHMLNNTLAFIVVSLGS